MKKILWLTALVAPLLLSACSSGGGDGSPPATSGLPPDINSSPQSFIAYIRQLIAETDAGQTEDKEPVDLTDLSPAAPEDAEPEPVS